MKDFYYKQYIIPPIGIVLLIVSGLFFIGSGISASITMLDLSQKTSTNGKIIRYDYDSNSDRYYPVIEFLDEKDIKHIFQDNLGSTTPLYQSGSIVQVVYNYENPKIAEFTNLYFRWGLSFFLFGMCCISFYIAKRFSERIL